jgi:hypothetical protein
MMLLCACVLMQMLGIPATLWNFAPTPDAFSTSVSEGFSLPVSFPLIYATLVAFLPETIRQSPHNPLLTYALFHPPVVTR